MQHCNIMFYDIREGFLNKADRPYKTPVFYGILERIMTYTCRANMFQNSLHHFEQNVFIIFYTYTLLFHQIAQSNLHIVSRWSPLQGCLVRVISAMCSTSEKPLPT